jgi:hypothetical protein
MEELVMRSSWYRSVVSRAALSGVVLALAASPALAQGAGGQKQPAAAPAKPKPKPKTDKEKKEAAKKAFEEANAKMAAGDFKAAYELFKEADEYVPGAVPKFKMAEALDKSGDVDGAQKAYEAFLASNPPPDKNQERIDAAKARIEALKTAPADVKVTVMPAEALGATFMVDGAPQASNPLKVPPGHHTITVKSDGFVDGTQEVDVTRGEKKEITVTLTAKPKEVAKTGPGVGAGNPPPGGEKPQPPKPAEEEGGGSLVPAIVTLSLAGTGAIVGTVFGVLALSSKSSFDDTPTQDLFDETERNALIADMSFGVALTFGVTGLVLLLTNDSGSGDEAKPAAATGFQLTPYAGPGGAGAVGTFHF